MPRKKRRNPGQIAVMRACTLHGADWKTAESGKEAKFYRLTKAGRKALESETHSADLTPPLPRLQEPWEDETMKLRRERCSNPSLRKIPVIVISGSERDEDRARVFELQAAAYLVKPTDVEKYFLTVRQIKELWVHSLSFAPKETNASA